MAADAYVPGHSHDLFVSYAWVDDPVPGKTRREDGWVHTLAGNLGTLLASQLGRADWGDIWIDSRVDRAQAITPEVEEALAGSALLLLVLAKGWLESPWCRHELERFAQRHGRDGTKGRIFVVHKTRIEPRLRPEPIRDLIGYDLYHGGRDGRERQLGFPVPLPDSPEDREYFNRLDDLSRDLGRRLRELQGASGMPPPKAQIPETLAVVKSPETGGRAIYLAEVTPDLRARRDSLLRQLDQSGFATRPASLLPASPADYRESAERELAESLLFVQLLGPYTLDKRPDLPQGYEALQLELAQAAGLPVLRWMDSLVDQRQLDDPGLFARTQVLVCGFEDFKRRVEQEARLRLIPPPPPDTQVLIRATAEDEDVACDIGDRLVAQGVGYEVADERAPLADLVKRSQDQPYQGLMVVYDRCDRDWARQQVNECRVIAMARKDRAPACAVFDAPRDGKRRLGIAVPRFHWLSRLDGPELGRFVQTLRTLAGMVPA